MGSTTPSSPRHQGRESPERRDAAPDQAERSAGHHRARSRLHRRLAIGTALIVIAGTLAAATVVPGTIGGRSASGWWPWNRATGNHLSGTSGGGAAAALAAAGTPGPAGSGAAASGPVASGPAASGAPGAGGPGAAAATAGAGSAPCVRRAGASGVVTVTELRVRAAVTGYGGQGDTEPLPMAIAATPAGGSWLAWLGTDKRVHLGRLDCNDHLVGTPTSFEGIDLQDVQADAKGGVLLLTRRGSCHTGPLCGGTSSPCNTMWMVRFDGSGRLVWQRQVTNLSSTLGGYDDGARFVWWYQHHGRLASDGTTYAAYFSDAITVRNGTCVDIHEGDRMQVVNAKGALVPGQPDSFGVGCSHSWDTRIVWDPRTRHYAMVCATDNACRIAQPNPYRTVASGACDGTLFGGDLVLARNAGYWTAWSRGGLVRLTRFGRGTTAVTLTTPARSGHPHLVTLGSGRMLLAWRSGSAIAAQVYDSASGRAVGARFTIGVRDHSYQAFKSYPDGSAAYPAAGSSSTSIRIARVMPVRA